MSAQLSTFNFEGKAPIRTILRDDGEPWVVAKDAAEALGYSKTSNPARLFAHIPEEWRGVNPIHTPSGIQEMVVLSEAGLFFFLARSDKPKALPFQKWIAGEVLPAIRRTGAYSFPGHMAPRFSTGAASTFKNTVAILGELDGLPETMDHIRKHSAGSYRNTKELHEQMGTLTRAVIELLEVVKAGGKRIEDAPERPYVSDGGEESLYEGHGFIRNDEAARRLGILPSLVWGACKQYGLPRARTRLNFKMVHWASVRDFFFRGDFNLGKEEGSLFGRTGS